MHSLPLTITRVRLGGSEVHARLVCRFPAQLHLRSVLSPSPVHTLTAPPAGQACVDALAAACLALLHAGPGGRRYQAQSLAQVLWNLSRLGHLDPGFYRAFVPGACMRVCMHGEGWGGGGA